MIQKNLKNKVGCHLCKPYQIKVFSSVNDELKKKKKLKGILVHPCGKLHYNFLILGTGKTLTTLEQLDNYMIIIIYNMDQKS